MSIVGRNVSRRVLAALALLSLIAAMMPMNVIAKGTVFADSQASGKMTGSAENPHKSLQTAIDQAAREGKTVTVKKGTYKENITLKKKVELIGEDRDQVVILADDKRKAVVIMEDGAKIRKATLKKGEIGILVKKNARATIDKCNILENKEDGIKIEKADKKDSKNEVGIFNSRIADNGWNGIFVRERKTVIMDNLIEDNGRDGVELEKNSKSWIEGNSFKNNDGDGLKVTLDDSRIGIKGNNFRGNDREGLEIRSEGKSGFVSVKKSKFYRNGRYGIARVETVKKHPDFWKKALDLSGLTFWDNRKGEISEIIRVW